MRLRVKNIWFLLCVILLGTTTPAWAEDSIPESELQEDTIRTKKVIDQPIVYVSKDSMTMLGTGIMELHGDCEMTYGDMKITSAYMKMNTDSNLLYAHGRKNPFTGELEGKPLYKSPQDEYECKELTYNIKTEKGFIRGVVTQQGEGYIISDRTKKHEGTTMTMAGGQYTTCDDHEHPHFYLKLTKAKVVPDDYIATGPAYLVVGDVPLPLAIPFGFFPLSNTMSSGIIMPQFGDDQTRGLYAKGMGYYMVLNDYADLELTGDLYTKGTWAVYAKSRYTWRYHFTGNISMNYRQDVTGEPDMPDYSKHNNFSLLWSHSQDSKANPFCTFSASVNFSTSGYNRSNIDSYYKPDLNSENTKSSTISYTQRFPDSPWSLTMSAQLSQRTKDSTMSLTLPDLSINMSSINPFKRKHPVGKERWYEKIKMSYSATARIAINNVKEDKILHSNFLRDWQVGMQHSLPMSASFTVLKYLNITPNINMKDRMYFQRVDQTWDEQENRVHRDTTNGFYNVFDFNVGVSMSTKLYGFFIPSKKVFPHSKVDRFRHVMTPSLSFSYHPDFGKSFWGYYGSYDQPVYEKETDANGNRIQRMNDDGTPMVVTQYYSRFPGAMYGTASRGAAAQVGFSLGNNLEMKVVNREDTTGKKPFKVISLIDDLSLSGGYNFIADSMNWSNFNVRLRIKLPKLNYTINLSTQLDPYMYQLNAFGTPIRTNKQYWHNGRFPHWTGTSTSLNYTFNNQTLKKWIDKIQGMSKDTTRTRLNYKPLNEREADEGYEKVDIPWSVSVNYTLRYGSGPQFDYDKMYYKMVFTHNLSLSGSLGLGKGWKVTASTSYDFKHKCFSQATFNVTRDLHCWNMSASFVPFGPYKSYTFHIGVNASMLSQMKYDKSSQNRTDRRVDWW